MTLDISLQYILLAEFLFILFSCCFIFVYNSWLLYKIKKSKSYMGSITATVIIHVCTWWLVSICGIICYFYYSVTWRPDEPYNPVIHFIFYLPWLTTIIQVPFSAGFLSLDRCCVLILSPAKYSQIKTSFLTLEICCLCLSVVGVVTVMIVTQVRADIDYSILNDCWSFSCIVNKDAFNYLIIYNFCVSLFHIIAAVVCLILFKIRKSHQNVSKNKNAGHIVHFTIIVELLLDLLPLITIILLNRVC